MINNADTATSPPRSRKETRLCIRISVHRSKTNLFGTIIVMKGKQLPYFRERKAGHFFQFSSMGGRIGPQGAGPIRPRNGVSKVFPKFCRAKSPRWALRSRSLSPAASARTLPVAPPDRKQKGIP